MVSLPVYPATTLVIVELATVDIHHQTDCAALMVLHTAPTATILVASAVVRAILDTIMQVDAVFALWGMLNHY